MCWLIWCWRVTWLCSRVENSANSERKILMNTERLTRLSSTLWWCLKSPGIVARFCVGAEDYELTNKCLSTNVLSFP